MNEQSRQVRRAIAIIARENGDIAFVYRYNDSKEYLGLPKGYLCGDDKFDMAKEGNMDTKQKLEFQNVIPLVRGQVENKRDDELQMVYCVLKEDPENGIGALEYQLIWLDEEEVLVRLHNYLLCGEDFYDGLNLSEKDLNTLMTFVTVNMLLEVFSSEE